MNSTMIGGIRALQVDNKGTFICGLVQHSGNYVGRFYQKNISANNFTEIPNLKVEVRALASASDSKKNIYAGAWISHPSDIIYYKAASVVLLILKKLIVLAIVKYVL